MQHKPRYSRPIVLSMALLGLVTAVVAVLLMRDLTVPQQLVEKPLDVQALSR